VRRAVGQPPADGQGGTVSQHDLRVEQGWCLNGRPRWFKAWCAGTQQAECSEDE
jgi:hypothetical protein